MALRRKLPELQEKAASVLFVGERGNGNSHSLLLVRSCLWDVIEGAQTEAEQFERIYNRLNSWIKSLFEDGELERAFKAAGLDSGCDCPELFPPTSSPPACANPTPAPAAG
jgi:hypothetical protein